MKKGLNPEKINRIFLITLVVLFCLFVAYWEKYKLAQDRNHLHDTAQVIASALWNLDPDGPAAYLELVAEHQTHERITVFAVTNEVFWEVTGPKCGFIDMVLESIGLIPKITLHSDVFHKDQVIGRIEAVHRHITIYLYFDLLLIMGLILLVARLYARTVEARNILEVRVVERTRELVETNQDLQQQIQERSKAEKALRENETQLRTLIETLPALVWLKDPDGIYLSCNSKFERFFGAKQSEIIGKTDYDFVDKELADFFKENDKAAMAAGGASRNEEEITYADDGHKEILETIKTPMFDSQGRLIGVLGVGHDITEHKKMKADLFQAQKMEAIGTLAGGIAHDFNNILSVIVGYSEIAQVNILAGTGQPDKDIDEVLTASKRATELVKQILTFSRKAEHHTQPLNPHVIVKEALKMLRSSLPTTISIQQNIDSECGLVLADPINIHQIVINLCTNAVHAMTDEKGTLTLSLERKNIQAEHIRENDVSPGDFIVLKISDTGHGMDRHTIKRIFEPYFTTKEIGKGTGLGLAVIHGIIKEYNGFIEVESVLGKGTTIQVYIPALEKDRIIGDKKSDHDVPLPAGAERILIVDDEEPIVNMHRRVLEHLGYTVSATTDSLDALAKIQTNPDDFDLLITDQTMPGMTGSELAQKILQIKPGMPILLCTGYSSVLTEGDALAIGIMKYAKKPVNRTTLAETVRQMLDEK